MTTIFTIVHAALLASTLNSEDATLAYPQRVQAPKNLKSGALRDKYSGLVFPQIEYLQGHYWGWQECIRTFYFGGREGLGKDPFRRRRMIAISPSPYRFHNKGRKDGYDACQKKIEALLKKMSESQLREKCPKWYYPPYWKNASREELSRLKEDFKQRKVPVLILEGNDVDPSEMIKQLIERAK